MQAGVDTGESRVLEEAVRLQMLDAIGMDALIPRYQLPGATPSEIVAVPQANASAASSNAGLAADLNLGLNVETAPSQQANSAQAVQPNTQVSEQQSSMAARVLAIQAGSDTGQSNDAALQTPSSEAPATQAAASGKVDFGAMAGDLGAQTLPASANLALLEAGREFFIVDQIPERQVFSKYQTWFLQEVLFAYAIRCQELNDEQLRWPPKNMPPIDEPGRALLELLQGKIQALSPDLKAVLVLGNGLAGLAKALDQSSDVEVLFCPLSSAQVMMQPQQKAQMWQQLQALKTLAK